MNRQKRLTVFIPGHDAATRKGTLLEDLRLDVVLVDGDERVDWYAEVHEEPEVCIDVPVADDNATPGEHPAMQVFLVSSTEKSYRAV